MRRRGRGTGGTGATAPGSGSGVAVCGMAARSAAESAKVIRFREQRASRSAIIGAARMVELKDQINQVGKTNHGLAVFDNVFLPS